MALSSLPKMTKDEGEFESFMDKVDTIGSIIKRLCSEDKAVCEQAEKEADLCLDGRVTGAVNEGACVVKHDRTVINRSAFEAETLDQASSSKEAFMGMMSKDSAERAKSKRERESRAKVYMQDAMKHKEEDDYESALYLYTKAIEENVNWPTLFIERAKILLKLKLAKRAMEDCDKALKLNEDLLFLKGDSATSENRAEADLIANEIANLKEEITSFNRCKN